MHVTYFTPIFVILAVLACFGVRQWVVATVLGAFFQGATPVLVLGEARTSGIESAYALLGIGFVHWLVLESRGRPAGSRETVRDGPLLWLIALTGLGVIGALFLPRLFVFAVQVLPPRWGLDTYLTVPLRPSGGNLIQAFYLVCNLALFFLCGSFVGRGRVTATFCIQAIAAGAVMSALTGLYQVASYYLHLPWPDAVINSNLGVEQPFAQTALGIKRMSATFFEPSMLAMHFLGLLCLFALGLRRLWLAGLLLLCLVLSTSATAYAGMGLIAIVWIGLRLRKLELGTVATVCIAAAAVGIAAVYLLNSSVDPAHLTGGGMTGKLGSASGQARSNANHVAFNAFVDSWGLGVGVGSTRASSLAVNLAAGLGIPGLIAAGGFLAALLARCRVSGNPEAAALAWALVGMLAGWLLSVPDLALPLPWLIAGMANGAAQLGRTAIHSDPGDNRCALAQA